jgi:hypothetical protein
MKKMLMTVLTFTLILSACLPAAAQPEPIHPTPISEDDLRATAAVLSQQTLQALPTPTIAPSETPVFVAATSTPIQETPTETQNPILLTLTATLGTGTVTGDGQTLADATGTLPFTGSSGVPLNPTKTPHPLFYGTLPPNLPFGNISLVNKAKVDVYISLRAVTSQGYVTILEYPVKNRVDTKAPSGKYTYVAWVGGRQFTGSFSLSKEQDLLISIFKDKITIQ